MAYGETSPSAPPAASLLQDSGRLIERLSDIYNRAVKVGNMLHGSQPRDTSGKGLANPEPDPTLRRQIDRAHSLVSDIEAEFARIEGRL